ncbi:hypothetical protein HIR71_06530 [Cellulomonas fimi]|uniref:Heavy metal transporter n=1 Tax=Cellulomonas fimi TaxID=1708 RepID=A0A7Y0LXU3_CELFI|nr:hypothetical protein [Cellulomonas fimi]
MRRRRAWRRSVTLLVVLVIGVVGVVVALDRVTGGSTLTARCAAINDGTSWFLSPAQAGNAALLAGTAERRGLPARAVTIGIATALQESKLLNIDYGDRDSVGLFQQRPSQGWGTVEQIMDPVYSTNAFYDGLVKVAGYEELEITVAAQRVQRSGFPDAYAQHEARSRAWASALTGNSPAALTCELGPAESAGGADAVQARLQRDYGEVPTSVGPDGTVVVAAGALSDGDADDDARLGWALAQWSVAVAGELELDAVATADQVWTRAEAAWAPSGTAPLPPGDVRLTLAPG